MTRSGAKRSKMFAFIAALALSSLSMLWVFWRFPLGTLATAALFIAVFGAATRLAGSLDFHKLSERKRRNQQV